MADCRIVNAAVEDAVGKITNLADKYKEAGDSFEAAFMAAIAEMEGDAKDAMEELFENSYKEFVTSEDKGLPAMIKGLATLLEGNRKNFEDVDKQIADSIRNGGQQQG